MIRLIDEQSKTVDQWATEYMGLVGKIFGKGGDLVKQLGFEYREQQGDMAKELARSLVHNDHLVVEAGTGVGKSLAYLIPSILFARETKRPCVVATNTISLQEQLLEKDVPSVRDLFNRTRGLERFADFRCALLVGRANYLCTNRLGRALSGQSDLFEVRQRDELHRIAEWVAQSPLEGIRQELSPVPMSSVWETVNADSSLCSPKNCNPENCYYRKARALVENAEVIVVNHSLFFSLMGAGMGPDDEEDGVLFPSDFVVFDEAHEMADVASEHLGVSLSSWGLENFLRRLYNPKKRKGLLAQTIRQSDADRIEEARLAVEDFFQFLHIETLGQKDLVRLRHGQTLPMEVFPPFSKMLRSLVELGDLAQGENKRLEIKDQVKRAQGYLTSLSEVVEQKNKDHVYWVERTGAQKQLIHLRSAPINVAESLRRQLFSRGSPVVMTSATLTRNGKAQYFKEQIGLEKSSDQVLASPFDYESSMKVRIFSDAPNPMTKDRLPYLNFLSDAIYQLARSIEGGTLVLFTNYSDLKFCYGQVLNKWQKLGRSIYAQGEELPRSELRKRMIEEGDVLLLGAESFWKGFDAKGACLSQVIITRLPFENPNHPLKEARSEFIESKKGNPFREITLPSAVMRFRQGVGRLIRSQSDYGELVILDSRILRQGYGKEFLSELPCLTYDRTSIDEALGGYQSEIDNDIDF